MLLNWRLVTPQLTCTQADSVMQVGETPSHRDVTDGTEWDATGREGCGSPLELQLLLTMRQHGLPEPEKQFRLDDGAGRMITRAEFTYPAERLLIYVDGLAFHSSLRQRIHDGSQTNRLQVMDYRVLRFISNQITRTPGDCVDQIRRALAVGRSNP
jgi:very-short-patch-repair endonuclease